MDIFQLNKSNRKLLATSSTDERVIFIWNLNNIRKNKSYGESMSDEPDKTLLIGDNWRMVNFKWLPKSNGVLASVKHHEHNCMFKLLRFNVGTCDHFQMAKATKNVNVNPLSELLFDSMIEDFCFAVGQPSVIFVIGEKKQAMIDLDSGMDLRRFDTMFASNAEEPPKPEHEETEQFVDSIEATRTSVMFAFNKFTKVIIHNLKEKTDPMNINFDKQICSIRSNYFESSIFLVLVNDMFVLFDDRNMNGYRMIEYPTLTFHDISWSPFDGQLILVCGEFKRDEQITFSGFIKLKRFKSFQSIIIPRD